MTDEHDDRHEEELRLLVCDAEDARAALAASPLAGCEACHEVLDALLDADARMTELGRAGRAELAELLERGGAPETGSAEERALEEILGEARKRTSRPARRLVATAAAAAVFLLAFFLWPAPRVVERGVLLGEETPLSSPVGAVDAYAPFAWEVERPENGWFEVSVFAPGASRPLLVSPRIRESPWTPAAEELERLPDRIRWRLDVHGGASASDVLRSLQASAELRSP